MKRLIQSLALATLLGISATAYSQRSVTPEEKLRSATEIVVDEKVMNIGKDYDIKVDGETVAKVSGKNVKLWADEFTLETIDGKVLASEREHRRILSLNRVASVRNPEGEIVGYIGEEKIKDFFKLSYVFHFYDANLNEIGVSNKLGKGALNRHKILDNNGNEDYYVDTKFHPFGGDQYVLKVRDPNSEIPLEQAILLVCIEDAIGDAN